LLRRLGALTRPTGKWRLRKQPRKWRACLRLLRRRLGRGLRLISGVEIISRKIGKGFAAVGAHRQDNRRLHRFALLVVLLFRRRLTVERFLPIFVVIAV
jgi:hypothetical protein